jgi:ketosteroid isomerase-like protein
MTTAVSRKTVEAFYQAFASSDPAKFAPFLDGDVTWNIAGPVELISYCGERRGKAAVVDLYGRIMPAALRLIAFEPEILLVDGDRCATLVRLTGETPGGGRVISYRCTQFLQFRDNKVIACRAIIDSFDAAEQFLGHPIDLSHAVDGLAPPRRGVVAV